MNVALFYNSEKFLNKHDLLEQFISVNSKYFNFYLKNKNDFGLPLIENFDGEFDFVFAIGGDGTMLSTIRDMKFKYNRYVGIKMGHLGFLSCIEFEKMASFVDNLLKSDFITEDRYFLEVIVKYNGKIIDRGFALNDVVVERENIARMMRSDIYINEERLSSYNSNGLIVSTPTGSTAYNMSAGGPIVYTGVKCMILTPICSHSLGQRPVIFDENSTLTMKNFGSRSSIAMTLDGQRLIKINSENEIIINLSKRKISLVRPEHYSFSRFLSSKLNWNN